MARHQRRVTNKNTLQRMREQVNSSPQPTQEDYYWGHTASGTEEDYYWRRLSDLSSQKDLLPGTYLEMHNLVYEAWNANPIAAAIIEMTTSFVLGKGVTIAATNRNVQRILQQFWDHPSNHMDERVYAICQELSLYGEIFVRFFVNTYDGSVKVRLIDPSLIDEIETDPEDIETVLRFHRRPGGQIVASTDPPQPSPQSLRLVDQPSSSYLQGEWYEAGREMMQFAINKVSNAKRGRSDLAPLLPWLRRYKDWLLDRVRINKYKGAFLWDVQLQGADRKTIERKRMEYSYAPEPGSIILHNEAEQWRAVQPAINASDAQEDGRAIKLMIAVGAGLPEHYLSDSSQGNRATAAEMSLPTLLKFQRRQNIIAHILRCILDRVIQEAQQAGRLGKGVETSYDILFPEIDVADHQTLASAVQSVVSALATARAQGWVSDETAMRLLFSFANEEIDIHQEKEKIAGEKREVG